MMRPIKGFRAMPRYYFQLTGDDGPEPDESGMELPDLLRAKHAAPDGPHRWSPDWLEFEADAGEILRVAQSCRLAAAPQ